MSPPAKKLGVSSIFACIFIIGIVAVGCFFVFRKFEEGQKCSHATGAAASLAAALAVEIQSDNAEPLRNLNLKEGEDKRLSNSEYDELVIALSKRHPLDLPKNWRDTGILVDPWGNRYEIVLKHHGSGWRGLIIRSYGADGIAFTKDDLVHY